MSEFEAITEHFKAAKWALELAVRIVNESEFEKVGSYTACRHIGKESYEYAPDSGGFETLLREFDLNGELPKIGESKTFGVEQARDLFEKLAEVPVHDSFYESSLKEITSGSKIVIFAELSVVHLVIVDEDDEDDEEDEELQNQIACLTERIECINDELEPLLSEERGYTIEDTLRVVIYLGDYSSRFSKRVSAYSVINCLGYSPTLKKSGEIIPRASQIYPDMLLMLIKDAKKSKEHVGEEILQKLLINCLNDEATIASMAIEF